MHFETGGKSARFSYFCTPNVWQYKEPLFSFRGTRQYLRVKKPLQKVNRNRSRNITIEKYVFPKRCSSLSFLMRNSASALHFIVIFW